MNERFTAADWLTNFRMSKNTFLYMCNELHSHIEKQDTNMRVEKRVAITVEKRVAVTLWFLATDTDYFWASVCLVCKEVCRAIVKVLLPKYICIPTGCTLDSVMSGFAKRGFPQCAGAELLSPLKHHRHAQLITTTVKGGVQLCCRAL